MFRIVTTNPNISSLGPIGLTLAVQQRLRELQDFTARQKERLEIDATHSSPRPQPNLHSAQETPSAPLRPRITPEAAFETYALSGLAGKVVRTLAPHTEAEPAAILLQLLVAFGNVIGPGPHCVVGATRHALNLFAILVGESSKARKGTSWSQIARLFAEVDRPWIDDRVNSARLTAHGLIKALRDEDQTPNQKKDRRLLLLSEEFASVLHTMARSRTQVSPLLRNAWDSGTLRARHHDTVLEATGSHISLIGHISQRELAEHLNRTETHNGFVNRCLWLRVQRAGCVPDGGNLAAEDLSAVAQELRYAVDWARGETEIVFRRDPSATELWNDYYPTLSQANPGVYSAATARAEAQVLRLSALYAALDCSESVRLPHLYAAFAVWDLCTMSSASLFGTCTGDSTADRIREALEASPEGLSRNQIRALLHGNVRSDVILQALLHLQSLGLVYGRTVSGRGRPATIWCSSDHVQAESTEHATVAVEEPLMEEMEEMEEGT